VRHAIAAMLGVTLVATVALAAEWIWYCPRECIGASLGTAYYDCPQDGVFTKVAYYTDDDLGPPDRLCPTDSVTMCHADSVVCNANSAHRWYAPLWEGYK